MNKIGSSDILFNGFGLSQVGWIRTGMPSYHLGCDWIATVNRHDPNNMSLYTSISRKGNTIPSMYDYKIVVLQQVYGEKWKDKIIELRNSGIKVIYEIDDYLQGVRHVRNHFSAGRYTREHVNLHMDCLKECDAVIVSTEELKKRYDKYNKNIYICKNSVDINRCNYFYKPPVNDDIVTIGWAGGTGHDAAVRNWLGPIASLMYKYKNVHFFSIGERFMDNLKESFKGRIHHFAATSLENYHPALLNFDISIAPSGRMDFHACKSDLRWIDASAMGIPSVVDPWLYKEAEHGYTALCAESSLDMKDCLVELIENPDLRDTIGENAKEYVSKHRSFPSACSQWQSVFVNV